MHFMLNNTILVVALFSQLTIAILMGQDYNTIFYINLFQNCIRLHILDNKKQNAK